MPEPETDQQGGVHAFEKRYHRSRKFFWYISIPVALVLAAGYAMNRLQESMLLAGLGLLVAVLVMMYQILDILGYLGSVERRAADDRVAIRQDLSDLKNTPTAARPSGRDIT